MATGISEVIAKGSASVTQKVAIINITYAHLKACKKIKERAFRLNTGLSELGAEGSHAPSPIGFLTNQFTLSQSRGVLCPQQCYFPPPSYFQTSLHPC